MSLFQEVNILPGDHIYFLIQQGEYMHKLPELLNLSGAKIRKIFQNQFHNGLPDRLLRLFAGTVYYIEKQLPCPEELRFHSANGYIKLYGYFIIGVFFEIA